MLHAERRTTMQAPQSRGKTRSLGACHAANCGAMAKARTPACGDPLPNAAGPTCIEGMAATKSSNALYYSGSSGVTCLGPSAFR